MDAALFEKLVESMTKRNIGDEIIEGMASAVHYMQGKKTRAVAHKINIPVEIDIDAENILEQCGSI